MTSIDKKLHTFFMRKLFTLGIVLSTLCLNISDALGQACSGTPATPTITSTALTTQCAGATPTITAVSNVTTTGNYFQWQSGPSATGPWTNIAGATALSYTTPALYTTTYYRMFDSCGGSGLKSFSAAYQVPIDVFSISTQPLNTTTCSGQNATFSVAASGFTLAYQWQVNTGSGFSNVTNGGVYAGATTASLAITGATAAMNGYTYQCLVSDACNPNTYTQVVTLTVNSSPTITTAPADYTGCVGGNASFNIAATGSNITYQWQVNTGSGYSPISNGGIYSGATTSTLNITGVTAGMTGYLYRCVLGSAPCSGVLSTGATLTVNTLPAITTQPLNDTVCSGNNAAYTVAASGSNISYQWQVNTGSGFVNCTNGALYSGVTGTTLNITNVTVGMSGYLYQCVVTGSCSPVATTTSAVLFVSQSPSITGQPLNDTICAGGNGTFNIIALGGALSYQWQVNPGTGWVNCVNGALYSGALTNLLTITAAPATMNAYSYRCVATSNSCSAAVTSNAAVFVVNTAPNITTQPQPSTICQGANTSFSIVAGGTNITYQWQVNTGTGFANCTNGALYGGVTTNSLSLTAVTAGMNGYTYRCIVSGSYCSAATSNAVLLTVNPTLVPSLTISSLPVSPICSGTSVTFTAVPTNGGAAPVYQWKLNGVNVGTNSTTYTNAALPVGSNTITCTLTSNATCASPTNATSNTITMVVNANVTPSLTIAAVPAGAICSGTSVTFTATPVNGGTTPAYQWKLNGANVGTGLNTYTNATLTNGNTISCVLTSNATCATPPTATSNTITETVNPLPTATITPGGPTTFCAGGSVVLTASAGVGVTYQWYLNGAIINGQTAQTYTANASGSYTVKVTYTATGCNATSAATVVTVNALPVVNLSAGGPLVFCAGGSVTLTASLSTTYQWKLNGVAIGGATAQTYTATLTGTYSVTVTNAAGCSATSGNANVVANPLPNVALSLSGPSIFCAGDSLTITVPSVVGITYQWYLNGTAINGATANSYKTYTAGTYYVKATNSSTGCFATSASTTVTVNALPVPVITPNGPLSFCAGGAVSFDAIPIGSGISYKWYLGASQIVGALSSSYTASASGTYTCLVTNGNGCSAISNPETVVVNPLPAVPVITANGPTTFCIGSSVYLSTPGVAGNTYQWNNNLSPITGAIYIGYVANVTGSYTVTTTSDSGCSTTSSAVNIVTDTLPAPAIIGAFGPTTFCWGSSVQLGSTTVAGTYTYQWMNDLNTILGGINATYTAPDTGTYSLQITDANGCSSVSNTVRLTAIILTPVITQNVDTLIAGGGNFATYQWYENGAAITGATSATYVPTQNGTYYVLVTDSTPCQMPSSPVQIGYLGINNTQTIAAGIKVYPNPAINMIHVSASVKVNAKILGLDGKVALQTQEVADIDISNLGAGIYLLQLFDENNNLLKVEKLIKTGL